MSTIGPALAALATLAESTLTGWQVINGPASSVTTLAAKVCVVGDGDVVGSRVLSWMSLVSTTEDYLIPVTLSVSLPGTNQQAADDLVMAAYGLLESAIRLSPNLGLAGIQDALPVGDFRLQRQADADVRSAAVRFAVRVIAQNI